MTAVAHAAPEGVAQRAGDILQELLVLTPEPPGPGTEIDPEHLIVSAMLDASAAVGRPSRLSGLDSWFDAASFSRFGGTPCIGWGPSSIAWAHTIDEYVPVMKPPQRSPQRA